MADKRDEDKRKPEDAGAQPGPEDEARPDDGPPEEIGGRGGPDPTRYGDWEKNGRCVDF